jgi:peroxiredoxin
MSASFLRPLALRVLTLAAVALPACATLPKGPREAIPTTALPATGGATITLSQLVPTAPLTVLTFFGCDCPCQRAHDARLKAYQAEFASRGVRFLAVDVEADSSLARDEKEATERALSFPIISDPEGKLADVYGAQFVTDSVILDRAGRVRYRGGVDPYHEELGDKDQWLHDAIVALLDGKEVPTTDTKAMGCALRRK